MLTPVIFRALNFAFIWHSIYWGVVTWVVIVWGILVLLTPLVGRIGCGWLCFMGTWQDLPSQYSLFKTPWSKPKLWIRIIVIVAFFAISISFLLVNLKSGAVSQIRINPQFLSMDFNGHYKQVWLYDSVGAVLIGFLLDRRWTCRNLCFMGAMCASGSTLSRLIPVVDAEKCNFCGKCDRDCLVKIPITQYVRKNDGLVTNSECLICGRCVDSCYRRAISIRFVWNRKKYGQDAAKTSENTV
jgi:polyferredoxin